MARYIPPKIEDVGLETYLNSTWRKHKELTYLDLVEMVSDRRSTTQIAKAFNVSRQTVYSWLNILRREVAEL